MNKKQALVLMDFILSQASFQFEAAKELDINYENRPYTRYHRGVWVCLDDKHNLIPNTKYLHRWFLLDNAEGNIQQLRICKRNMVSEENPYHIAKEAERILQLITSDLIEAISLC
jgi:hypothetical protein